MLRCVFLHAWNLDLGGHQKGNETQRKRDTHKCCACGVCDSPQLVSGFFGSPGVTKKGSKVVDQNQQNIANTYTAIYFPRLVSGLWGLNKGIEKQQKQTNSNMSRVCVFGFSLPEVWTLGGPHVQRKTTKHTLYTNKWIKCYVVCLSTPEHTGWCEQ